jgi:integrase
MITQGNVRNIALALPQRYFQGGDNMALRRLTDFAVTNARSKDKGYEVSDAGQRGLRLAVHPTGVKSWIVRYRHPVTGVSRKLTLQSGLGLADARRLAAEAMYQLAKGIDPIDAKRADKQAKLEATEGTLNAVAKRYLDLDASKLRSRQYYESTLRNHILPKLGQRPIAQLKRTEITAVLDRVEQTSGASAADAAKRVLSALMNWHQSRSDFVNPMTRIKSRLKPSERARTHVPSDDEIKRIWVAVADERVGTYGQVIRFMAMTGARRSEAEGLRRSEIETMRDNGDEYTVWRLPASRSKNKQEIMRPLSRAALDIVESMPIISDCDFVWTLNGRRPMSMNHMGRKRLLDELSGVAGWRLHDLRRVHRSLLSRCRVPFDIAERCLGHSQNLLVKTYDQHSHLPAMQEAMDKVSAEIARIVEGERKGKVVRLR